MLAALGGRRTAPLGLLAAAGIVDDVSGGPHLFRRLLPHRPTYNVTGTAGDPDAEETLVFVAHHDAANGGLIFRPELTRLVADTFPAWYARQSVSPQMLRLVAAGPALAGLGALLGSGLLRRLGTFVAAGSTLAFFDIGTRTVVPGANDNLTAVAVILELARMLREQPVERRARAARLHRLGGVLHGGHARLGAPPRPAARPRAHARRGARDAGLAGADPARGRGDDLDDRLRRRACAI